MFTVLTFSNISIIFIGCQVKIVRCSELISIEQTICDSHNKEKLYDETLAVTKIKSDPNFFSDMLRN